MGSAQDRFGPKMGRRPAHNPLPLPPGFDFASETRLITPSKRTLPATHGTPSHSRSPSSPRNRAAVRPDSSPGSAMPYRHPTTAVGLTRTDAIGLIASSSSTMSGTRWEMAEPGFVLNLKTRQGPRLDHPAVGPCAG